MDDNWRLSLETTELVKLESIISFVVLKQKFLSVVIYSLTIHFCDSDFLVSYIIGSLSLETHDEHMLRQNKVDGKIKLNFFLKEFVKDSSTDSIDDVYDGILSLISGYYSEDVWIQILVDNILSWECCWLEMQMIYLWLGLELSLDSQYSLIC